MTLQTWNYVVLSIYFLCLVLLSLFSVHRYLMLYLYYSRRPKNQRLPLAHGELPAVTVQLPIYNERLVIGRLLESVSNLDYPQDKLQIQILDDSTDDTRQLSREWTERLIAAGFDAELIQRENREGFKAGALQNGLATAKGEYVAIFDADFLAPRDFLLKVIPHFANPQVGMVQMRWDHLNRKYSLLTQLQSIMIDGHFVIENAARHFSGRFFNFNGTAGIWRRTAIHDAGGWQHDTLTEDLDLSYRAQLRGWNFIYLPAVTAPAELPVEINAFKTQQHRWTKGSIQTALKLLPSIWRSRHPLPVKIEATFHLANNFAYLFMFAVAVMMLPVILIRQNVQLTLPFWVDLLIFFSATVSIATFYAASQKEALMNWKRQLRYIPLMMSLAIGLCVNNAKAVLEALLGQQSDFVRTPKSGVKARGEQWWKHGYVSRASGSAIIETALAFYYAVVVGYCVSQANFYTVPFMLLFLFGFGYVGFLSLASLFSSRASMQEATEQEAA